MEKENQKSVLIIMGAIIVCVFAIVLFYNVLPNVLSSDLYHARLDEKLNAKIETLELVEYKVELVTSGDIDSYCIKTTKSDPDINAMCWTEVEEEKTVISILAGKKYYLWIKDTEENISSPRTIEK